MYEMRVGYCVYFVALVSSSLAFGQAKMSDGEADSLFTLMEKSTYNNPDSALQNASELEALYLSQEKIDRLAELYRSIGIIYKNKSEFHKSIEFHKKSIQVYKSLGDSAGVASNYNNLGNVYKYLGQKEKSLTFYLNAATLRETHSKPSEYARVLYNLGSYFYELNDYDKSAEYYFKAKDILEMVNHREGLADIYYNLGMLYSVGGDLEKSIDSYERAILLYKELNISYTIGHIWTNMGLAYARENKIEEARAYYRISRSELTKLDDRYGLCFLLFNYGHLELKVGHYKKALELAKELEFTSSKISALRQNVNAYELLYLVYEKMKQYQQSFSSFKLYNTLKDSLFNVEKNQTIQELTIRYETELKEREIEKLSTEKEMKEKEVMLATTEKNAYLVAIFFAAALALASIGFFNQRHKATQLSSEKALEQRNKQIDALLQEQEITSLNAMLEGQEQERIRIAEELHDRLGSLLSAIKLNFNGWIGKKDLSSEEIAEYSCKTSGLLDEAVTEVRRISHNLSSGQISKFGLLKSMEDLADTVNKSNGLSMKVMQFNLDKRLPVELETAIYRIVQEMLANVLKHSRATEFTVQLSKTDESVILTAEDNGIGFDQAEATGRGGMGLQNIEKRARKQKGQFSVDTAPGQGTIFTFEFPLTS